MCSANFSNTTSNSVLGSYSSLRTMQKLPVRSLRSCTKWLNTHSICLPVCHQNISLFLLHYFSPQKKNPQQQVFFQSKALIHVINLQVVKHFQHFSIFFETPLHKSKQAYFLVYICNMSGSKRKAISCLLFICAFNSQYHFRTNLSKHVFPAFGQK